MKRRFQFYLGLIGVALLFSGCESSSDLSALIRSKLQQITQWSSPEESLAEKDGLYGPKDEDFIPLVEEDLKTAFSEKAISQPKEIPGGPGSSIPALHQFRKPLADLALIFKNVYFNTDEYAFKKAQYFQIIDKIADYLKNHPNMVISIEGHCDERASESYNQALGTRRANYVRSLLVQKGVHPNRIHSITFGKEKPVDPSHTPAAWAKNRRAEFTIFEK
ncbi:MAG: OmpA family protein [Chlamydiae bacterium]|nr:OmpA family protein [Chlamydiota bacterium]